MTNRINCIDGWRAIAALGVLFTHILGILDHPRLLLGSVDLFKVLNIWGSGVHLFFVISGFCFFLVMNKNKNLSLNWIAGFWKKRWLRIAPAFYTACVVYGLIKYQSFSKDFFFSLFANFLFVQTYIPNSEIAALFWSLSVEWLFYLLLPFLFILMRKVGYIAGVAGLLLSGISLNLLHFTGYLYPGNFAWYYTIFANLEHFGWGILAGIIIKRQIFLNSFLSGIAGFVFGLVIAYAGKTFFYSGFVNYIGKWAFLFESIGPLIMTLGFSIMILSSLRNNILNRIFSNHILVFIGRISYSFYLWHILLLELCFRYFRQYITASSVSVGILAAITITFLLPLSFLSYKLLESFYFKLVSKVYE